MMALGKCFIFAIAMSSFAMGVDKCTNYCNNIYKPICAQSDQILPNLLMTIKFVNDCFMGLANCRSACSKFENTGCVFKCSSEPQEICAYNGEEYKDFVNPCEMKAVNCNTSKSE